MGEWQPIESAPYSTPVLVELENGETLAATLEPNASVNVDLKDCDQWWAVDENEAPACWTDGACWESNADEVMSLQPTHWQPLPAPPVAPNTEEVGRG